MRSMVWLMSSRCSSSMASRRRKVQLVRWFLRKVSRHRTLTADLCPGSSSRGAPTPRTEVSASRRSRSTCSTRRRSGGWVRFTRGARNSAQRPARCSSRSSVLYELKDGQLYTLSQDGGHPGGAFADPTLVIPKQGDVVLLGGAEGLVVGGTGKYRNASGPSSTRLKVETIGGFSRVYDELFFRFREVEVK